MFYSETVRDKRFYNNDLFRDYIFDYKALEDFFDYSHEGTDGIIRRIEYVMSAYDREKYSELPGIIRRRNESLGAGELTLKNALGLAKKDTVAVIGGQQPGLFGGPVFVIYKIITVLKLCGHIRKNIGVEAIPCFWNASDDSSLDQADNIGLISGGYRNIRIDAGGIDRDTRLSDIKLHFSAYRGFLEELGTLLSGAGPGSMVHSLIIDCLENISEDVGGGKKAGLSELFSSIILRLFSKWGPVIIDPSDRGFKKMGLDLLKWDISEHRKINELIVSSGRRLEKKGYHAQIKPNREVLDFFLNSGPIRKKIRITGDGRFRIGGNDYGAEKIMETAEQDPSTVSWNVVLRPLVQDSILPVAAAVCGPGEVSYFAQLGGVYRHLGIRMPVIYPRFSATIIEKSAEKTLERSGIKESFTGIGREEAVRLALEKDRDIDIEGIADGLERGLAEKIGIAEGRITGRGLDAGSSFDRIRRNLSKEIKVLKKKLYSALKKQEQDTAGKINRIYMEVFPEDTLQERKINIFYFLSKYGPEIIDGLYDIFRPSRKGHALLYLKEGSKDE